MALKIFEKLFPKKFLGIDIGVSSIKVVEVSKWGGGRTLENYGIIEAKSLFKGELGTFNKTTLSVSPIYCSRAVKAIIEEAKIKEKAVIFSIPDFSTFFVTFELPPMTESEIKEAVYYTAPQYLPLPLSETTLDWKLIEGRLSLPREKGTSLKVLVTAIPKEVVSQYQMIAQLTGLELYALESEVFGIAKTLSKEKERTVCFIDLGAHTSTVNILEKGLLKQSHSLDFGGNELTHAISKSLNIPYHQAEELKQKYGLMPSPENIAQILYPFIDPFLAKVKNIIFSFVESDHKTIDKIFLVGGGALLLGFKSYISEILKIETEIHNPFRNLLYPPDLEGILEELGPIFAPALGMALIGLDQV
jgi:type IV pilus assembly protein PilM